MRFYILCLWIIHGFSHTIQYTSERGLALKYNIAAGSVCGAGPAVRGGAGRGGRAQVHQLPRPPPAVGQVVVVRVGPVGVNRLARHHWREGGVRQAGRDIFV